MLNINEILDYTTEKRPIVNNKYYYADTVTELDYEGINCNYGRFIQVGDTRFILKDCSTGKIVLAKYLYPKEL